MQPEYLETPLPPGLELADLLPNWHLERPEAPLGSYGYSWDLRLDALVDGDNKTFVMWARSDPSVTMSVAEVLNVLDDGLRALKAELGSRNRWGGTASRP